MIAKIKKTNHWLALAASVSAVVASIPVTNAQDASKADPHAPPRIVATSPKIGETDVKADITEITVTFDRDMQSGCSWTGGPPD